MNIHVPRTPPFRTAFPHTCCQGQTSGLTVRPDVQSRCHRHDYQSWPGRRRDHDSLSTEFGDHFRYLSSYILNISTGKIDCVFLAK